MRAAAAARGSITSEESRSRRTASTAHASRATAVTGFSPSKMKAVAQSDSPG